MPLPPAQLLVQCGRPCDFIAHQRQQRQVAAQVNVAAPVLDHAGIGDPVFNEHAFGGRHGQEEFVKPLFVFALERPKLTNEVLESNLPRVPLQFEFQ